MLSNSLHDGFNVAQNLVRSLHLLNPVQWNGIKTVPTHKEKNRMGAVTQKPYQYQLLLLLGIYTHGKEIQLPIMTLFFVTLIRFLIKIRVLQAIAEK